MAADISQTVRRIIAEQTVNDIDDVKLESSLDELGLDSLKIVDIIFELEEEFGQTRSARVAGRGVA